MYFCCDVGIIIIIVLAVKQFKEEDEDGDVGVSESAAGVERHD